VRCLTASSENAIALAIATTPVNNVVVELALKVDAVKARVVQARF